MGFRSKFVLASLPALALWALLAPYLATYLIVTRPIAKADAIIVLSGSAVYRERTRKAAELYKQGISQRILITNDGEKSGWSQTEQTNVPYFELERRDLIANGVPSEAIVVLPGVVSGTDDEARAVAAEIDERPLQTLVIVTSPYHTRRALRTFEKILTGRGVDIGIEHPGVGEISPKPEYWWLSLRGWRLVFVEYAKSAVYHAYY